MAEEIARFGVLLRACRVAAGLSQEELMRRSGLDVRTIRNLERGRARWPYPDTVRRLADALDLHGKGRDEFMAAAGRRLAGGAGNGTALASGSQSPPSAGHGPDVPHELPGAVRGFVGRDGEMAALSELLEQAGRADPGTGVISAIGGTAGVGKTALAVHWAYQVAGRFPDGQLYVNLRGYDHGKPMPPADALAGFLRSLGVPGQDIPAEADQRAARYRSLLAGRRMLVMLDNAASAEQVRPLLPSTATCVTVITSRDPLTGLVVSDGRTAGAGRAVSAGSAQHAEDADRRPDRRRAGRRSHADRTVPRAAAGTADGGRAGRGPAHQITNLPCRRTGSRPAGPADEYISELRPLVTQHPAGERLHARLMGIPWHGGRQTQLPDGTQASSAATATSTLRPDPGLADAWTAIADDVNALSVEGYAEILAGLHRRFHDRLLDGILTVAGNLRPGRQRIIAGTFAYLDACRRESGVRSLLAGARAESAVRAEIQERNNQMSELIAPDFAEMGRSGPAFAARIWVAMAAEVALAESALAARLPDLRAALIEFLGPPPSGPATRGAGSR